jgi:ABC-type sulfate transport system permease subunit
VAKIRWSGPIFSALVSLVSALVVLVLVVGIDGALGEGQMSLGAALPAMPGVVLSAIVLCYPVHRLLARIDERTHRADDELFLG